MSQADKDAAKWMEASARFQRRELYKAKETGDAYHINQYGQVITERRQHEANCPAVDGFGCRCGEGV